MRFYPFSSKISLSLQTTLRNFMNTHIYIRSLFTLLVLLTLVSCRPKCSTPPAISECFDRLVTALDSSESYHQIQEKKLIDYKRKAASAGSDEARFYHYKLITELYYEFDVDSTEYYVQKNLEIARRNGKPQWEADCYLQAAHLYNCIGFFEQGREALDALSTLDKTFDQRLQYYLETIDYWNSKVWKETDNERKAALVEELQRTIDQMSPEDPWYALLCGEAGLLSLYVSNLLPDATRGSNEQDEVEYLTRYVVSSLRNVSRVTPLLIYVEQVALRYGELDIANRFLSALVRMQQDYPDRIRQPFYSFMTELNDATRSRLEEESRRNLTLLIVAAVSFIVMALLFVFAFYNLRRRIRLQRLLKEKNQLLTENSKRLKDEQLRLRDANEALRQASADLKEESTRLSEANYLKEEYIGQMFATCSEYLQKIEVVKRDINRKLTARQYDLALKATRPKNEDDMKEQHELWAKFDEIFLQLFPDFVEQFNGLLRPEERITLRAGEKLNTDLRIYAMVRLGINSSTKIAKILGLSTQSVYNARQKMRARATESEEEFPVRVRRLAINNSLIEGDKGMK